MEKIYDESHQQQRQKQRKKIKVDGVTMLSFAVALFAIVSLVAAGISGTSYAFPNSVTTLPNNFTGKALEDFIMMDAATMQQVDYHYYESGTNKIPLICLERNIPFANDGSYEKTTSGQVSDDAGLLYLLSNLTDTSANWEFPTGANFNIPADKTEYVKFWASQMTVWAYLYNKTNPDDGNKELTPTSSNKMSDFSNVSWVGIGSTFDDVSALLGGGQANLPSDSNDYFGYKDGTSKLVEGIKVNGHTLSYLLSEAPKKQGAGFEMTLSKTKEDIEQDSENKYYFLPVTAGHRVSDASLGEFVNYSITVHASDKDGKDVNLKDIVITDTAGKPFTAAQVEAMTADNFLVRIPQSEITGDVNISVEAIGNFRAFEGNLYTAGENTQKVTTVQFVNKSRPGEVVFEIVNAPDTGISVGQTIYFIGLIVLLCGVGIIYANAKQSEV